MTHEDLSAPRGIEYWQIYSIVLFRRDIDDFDFFLPGFVPQIVDRVWNMKIIVIRRKLKCFKVETRL